MSFSSKSIQISSRNLRRIFGMGLVLCMVVLLSDFIVQPGHAMQENNFIITGQLNDSLGQSIEGAHITGMSVNDENMLAETESRDDGTWSLELDTIPDQGLKITILIGEPNHV